MFNDAFESALRAECAKFGRIAGFSRGDDYSDVYRAICGMNI